MEVFSNKVAACFLPMKVRGCIVRGWETAEVGRFREWDWARHCEGRELASGQKGSGRIAKVAVERAPVPSFHAPQPRSLCTLSYS